MSANGKRLPMNSRGKETNSNMGIGPSPPSPPQEELIKFLCDSWNKVCQEYQKGTSTVAYHTETDPNPLLKDFVPFDLEAYWGKRMVQNITTQNVQNI